MAQNLIEDSIEEYKSALGGLTTAKKQSVHEEKSFIDDVKQRIQLTFKNVYITTTPKSRRFYDRSSELPPAKVILNGVSGTVLPG